MPATRYDKSKTTTRLHDEAAIQRLTVGAAAVVSAAIDSVEVMVAATSRCFVLRGKAPVVTAANGIPIEAGEKFYFQIDQGDKLSVIRDTADGVVHIVPVA